MPDQGQSTYVAALGDALPGGDRVLQRFGADLRAAYGDRLERVLLYGSRARGDGRADSDYDFAVFLFDIASRWAEMKRLSAIATDILDETGFVVHAKPYSAGAYDARTLLMHEIRRDGREI